MMFYVASIFALMMAIMEIYFSYKQKKVTNEAHVFTVVMALLAIAWRPW